MISIIIPIYNAEKYLRTCLDSIKNQSYQNFEVICVNDGSTDSSEQILKQLCNTDSRFSYYNKNHSNAGDARNMGLTHAKGEYILFLDSDDILLPSILNELSNIVMNNYHIDIVVFQYRILDDKTNHLSKLSYGITSTKRKIFSTNVLKRGKLNFTNIAVWNKLYSRTYINGLDLHFKSHASINDVFFSWVAIMNANNILLFRKPGLYYRTNTGNSISDNITQTSHIILKAFDEVNIYAIQNNLWDTYKKDLLKQEFSQLKVFKARLKKSENEKIFNNFSSEMNLFFDKYTC